MVNINHTKKIGIIGLGFIGKTIIDAIDKGIIKGKLQAIYDIQEEAINKVRNTHPKIRVMKNLSDVSDCDILVESAVQAIVEPLFDIAINNNKYFLPMSVGAFITNDSLYLKYSDLEPEKKSLILLPSGAIGGFDAINGIMLEGVNKVTLATRKPLKVFQNSDYIKNRGINLSEENSTIIFSGNAKEAAKNFPRSINVAARLALATLGPYDTKVEVIADPKIAKNIHIIKIESIVGNYEFTFDNNPSPTNPKTSWLAALSAVSILKGITEV